MKRFKAEQTQKSCEFVDNCVDLSKHVVLGGGAILSLLHKGFEGIVILRINTLKNTFNY